MDAVLGDIAQQMRHLSAAEVVAVMAAVAYLVLAIRENVLCWPFACISTAVYVALFFDARLYMEAVLNVFYFGMAVYGWHAWLHGGKNAGPLQVCRWPWLLHAVACTALIAAALANGWLLHRYTDAAYPYVDSLTTWGAIWATFLVARKVLENWWYWLVIDSVSVFVYWQRDLELTAMLFLCYVLLVPVGYLSWRRSLPASPA